MIAEFLFSVVIAHAQPAQQQANKPQTPVEATLDLEWEVVEDATSYEVKLTPANGGEPLTYLSSDTKLTKKLPAGLYKLQIRSKDKSSGYFGPWSEETEIEVAAKTVQLISPADGSEIAEPKEKRAQVEFQWTPIEGAKEYTLRIWFDDEKNAREFKSKTARKVLSLPSARSYAWQVTFLTHKSVGYMAAPQIANFKVLGKQLLKPIIDPKLVKIADPKAPEQSQLAKWKNSPGAQHYKVKLLKRALDEEDWQAVTEIPKQNTNELKIEKLKPGAYKIELIAQASNYVSSEPGVLEFVVKPTEAELAEAMKRAL